MTDVVVVTTPQVEVVREIQQSIQAIVAPQTNVQVIAEGMQGPPGPSAITAYAAGNTTLSSSGTLPGNSVVFEGASNISVGISAGSIIVSATGGGGGGNLTLSASTNSRSSGTINFSNANGVSFGMDTNGNITGSTTQASQTIQTANLVAVGQTTGSTSSTTFNTNLSFSGAGGASVGFSGDTVIISAATTASQTIQSANIVAVGNTTGSTSSTTFNTNLSFSGAGIASVGFSGDTIIISASTSQSVQTEGWTAVGNTTASTSSTSFNSNFSLSGAGGASVGFSGQTIVVSAPATSAHSSSAVGNTTGSTSSTTLGNVESVSGAGIVSVGFSGQTLIISASSNQSVQTEGWTAVGNTTASTSSTSFNSNFSLSGAGGASVGFSGQTIVISAPNSGALSTQSSSAIGNTTGSTSSATFGNIESVSGAGIVSVGFSGQTMIISASSNQSVQTEGWTAVGNTTASTSSTSFNSNFSLSGAGGASVGFSGQTIVVSAPATSAQSWTAVGNTTGSTSSTTFGNVFSISGASNASVGFSGQTIIISAGGGAGGGITAGQVVGNTTGLTSSAALNATLTASGAGIASVGYSSSSLIISVPAKSETVIGNTTGSTSSTTFGGVESISGAGIVSVGFSGQTLIVSGSTSQSVQTEGWTAVGNTTGSTSSTSFNSNFSISGAGGASVGFSGQTIIVSAPNSGALSTQSSSAVGNTTGSTSSTTFGNIESISGAGGVSVGFSGQTLIISGATGGAGGGATLSKTYFPNGIHAGVTGSYAANNINGANIQYCPMVQNLTISRAGIVISVSPQTSAAASSGSWSATLAFQVFTRTGSTLSSYTSTTGALSTTWQSNTNSNLVTGIRLATIPFAASFSPNEYWISMALSTATGGQLSATQSLYYISANVASMALTGFGNSAVEGGGELFIGAAGNQAPVTTSVASIDPITPVGAQAAQNYILQMDNYSITS